MSTMPRIAVLGSLNMDLIARCSNLPRAGETITADSLSEVAGGKGANQAVAAARLGAEVTMMGRVGDDAFASRLRENLEREGIDTSCVSTVASCSSGVALIAVEHSGENSIIVVPGANGRLSVDDVLAGELAIQASDTLMLQLEIPIDSVLAAIKIARVSGISIILDPAPAPSNFPPELFDVNVLCPNQSEASAILGREVRSIADAEQAAVEFNHRGVKCAIITLGKQGAVVSHEGTVRAVKPFEVETIDTTAAGDAFAGAFAVRTAQGDSIDDAVRFACAAGAIAASRVGAQPSLPTHDEVIDFVARS